MKVLLKCGTAVLIDRKDLPLWSAYNWYKNYSGRNFYVRAHAKYKVLYLHRSIMRPPKNKTVDHINGNTFDNRRCNLRICSNKENVRSSHKYRFKKSSKYRGVSFDKANKKWVASIEVNGKKISIGRFREEKEAAISYNIYALKYFKKFAALNSF